MQVSNGATRWLIVALAAAAFTVACAGDRPVERAGLAQPAAPEPTATPTPIPNRAPVISIRAIQGADQGLALQASGSFSDADDSSWMAAADFGDGEGTTPLALDGNGFTLRHTYAKAGSFEARISITDAHGNRSETRTTVAVAPRKVLFVQGIDSESGCPGGRGFAGRAPQWVADALASDSEVAQVASLGPPSFVYFSYSGVYCGGGDGTHGEFADYSASDTCGGISGPGGAGERMRSLIDRLAPSKVSIVGHSMGGLIAAYLAGLDPDWARAHIAGVVTLDSPLSGVPRLNLDVLALSSAIGDGCGGGSKSMRELSDGDNEVTRIAAGAGQVLPFYNLDATEKEGPLFGIRQAVPGGNTRLDGEVVNWKVGTSHSGLWSSDTKASAGTMEKGRMVACGIALIAPSQCERPPAPLPHGAG